MNEPTPAPSSRWKTTQALDPNAPPVYVGRRTGVPESIPLRGNGGVVFNRVLTDGEIREVERLVGEGFYKIAAKLYGGQVIEPTATP